jgi:2-hydroxy-3-oxopropionate reductase
MARRLLVAGHALTAWNRSAQKAQALAADGATVAPTAAAAVASADAVITMLDNGAVVGQVLLAPDVRAALRPGCLVIDMSSIAPAQARQHAALLRAAGMRCLDAPVSGGTVGAAAGALAIMAGGDAADVDAARPLFDALGRVTHVGAIGCGQLVKLANQMIVGMSIGAVAEALLLVERGGGDAGLAIQAMAGGFADSRVLGLHGARMAGRDFAKRAAMRVQLKDMDNALAAAQGLDLPITRLVAGLYRQAVVNGDSELDHSALWRELERINA